MGGGECRPGRPKCPPHLRERRRAVARLRYSVANPPQIGREWKGDGNGCCSSRRRRVPPEPIQQGRTAGSGSQANRLLCRIARSAPRGRLLDDLGGPGVRHRGVLRPTAQWPAPFGVRCETRHQRREVSLRNFVVDRVTHCLPIPLAAGGDAACVTTNDETSPATSPSPSTSTPRSTGELEARRVGWSGNRKRLSNVQHARSLRAMDGLRSRSPR